MVILYAAADDLQAWTSTTPPDNADSLLRSASIIVRHATRAAVYDTTTGGLPVDQVLADAMRDATCAQVAAWVTAGINPTAGPAGVTGAVTARNLGSASLSYGDASTVTQARADITDSLVPEAARILQAEGLLSNDMWWYG